MKTASYKNNPTRVLHLHVTSRPACQLDSHHIGEDTARRAAGVLDSGIKDAEFEEVRPPLPPWARELIEKQSSKNWKQIQEELLT